MQPCFTNESGITKAQRRRDGEKTVYTRRNIVVDVTIKNDLLTVRRPVNSDFYRDATAHGRVLLFITVPRRRRVVFAFYVTIS